MLAGTCASAIPCLTGTSTVVWLPFQVLEWVPRVNDFDSEMTFFVLQAGLSYLIFVVAMLLLAALTSRGKPTVSQLRTVASR